MDGRGGQQDPAAAQQVRESVVGNSQAPGRPHRQPHQEPLQLDSETQNGAATAPIRDRETVPTGKDQEAAAVDGLRVEYGQERRRDSKEWTQVVCFLRTASDFIIEAYRWVASDADLASVPEELADYWPALKNAHEDSHQIQTIHSSVRVGEHHSDQNSLSLEARLRSAHETKGRRTEETGCKSQEKLGRGL